MCFSYTFNAVNQLTALTDADDAHYNATVTCDANNNITSVTETYSTTAIPPVVQSTLTTDFTYDALNRLTEHKTTRYGLGAGKTHYTIRDHTLDALGRVAKSSYSAYYQGDTPSVSNLEHVYAGANHVQNYDGASAYGAVWHWAGSSSGAGGSARHSHGAPLNSPNPDTASQKGYNIAAMGGKNTPQRRTWTSPASEGNKREIYGQGRPMAKDSSGNGANWYIGTVSNPAGGGSNVESRFFFEGTVSATDMSRATDAREASRIGIFGTSNSYGGSYGRVTNEALGRDLNPLGRGDGQALVAGMLNVARIAPSLPKAVLGGGAQGNSVNNPCSSSMPCPLIEYSQALEPFASHFAKAPNSPSEPSQPQPQPPGPGKPNPQPPGSPNGPQCDWCCQYWDPQRGWIGVVPLYCMQCDCTKVTKIKCLCGEWYWANGEHSPGYPKRGKCPGQYQELSRCQNPKPIFGDRPCLVDIVFEGNLCRSKGYEGLGNIEVKRYSFTITCKDCRVRSGKEIYEVECSYTETREATCCIC